MAGSYRHTVNDAGVLYDSEDMTDMLENGGDVFEAVEEMYGMIWFLAEGDPARVAEAHRNYLAGIALSPSGTSQEADK